MIDFEFLTHIIPLIAISIYIPFVCYSDLKSRSFPPVYYLPLLLIGITSLSVYLLESPLRNYYLFGLMVAVCSIFFILSFIRVIGFSDAILISLIMLIMQYNPLTTIRIFYPLDFFWCIMLLTCALPIFVWANNIKSKNKLGAFEMLTHMRDHFPYTVLIALAFFVTLIAELFV